MRAPASAVRVLAPRRPEVVSELTRLALAASGRPEFRACALALLARTLPCDRAAWEALPPFGELRVEFPPGRAGGSSLRAVRAAGARLRLELERFGRIRAVLTLERDGGVFGARDVDWLRTLLPTLTLADEGTAGSADVPRVRALNSREAEVVDYVRLGYTNAQIALATGRSVAAVRNLLARVFDKRGVRTRAQLVDGPLETAGLTRREREIVEHLRAGLTNREIGEALGISVNTVRNTLARLFEKVGVSTRSELMGALTADEARPG
jgi:DNA-binding CsgD family transcriptional regulator